jgi:predicted ATPase/class 3 adenylate cyclase
MEKQFTFLFTDVEGSTRLWEEYPQTMSVLLAEHNRILQDAVESHHGRVFKTVGDGFCAVFDCPTDALDAANTAQRGLFHAKGEDAAPALKLKVRMGLHSGPAEERDGDYFGQTLNRVARLMAAASGGQTLISAAVEDGLGSALPAGVELRDLGNHRLRDIKEAEHVFQVVLPDLPSSFPPIKSLSPRPTNLPGQLTSFVGRERELDELCRLLRRPQIRLLTLLGPGGIGKTRLSIQVGRNLQDEYEDGTYFVALAPVSHTDAVIHTIAEVLKVEESGETSLLDAVKAYLENRHLLLLLDNFEQVIDAAPLVNELLAAAPRVKAVVTSREELMIYGERVVPVLPLTLPEAGAIIDMRAVRQSPAVMLFAERAQTVQPEFTLDETSARPVIDICQRLEGLPLAIELAAMRTRDLSVEEIAAQLSNRMQVLSKGPRDFTARQRTMRGAIEWSYSLLPAEERSAFARFGVFVGPFTADAADAIAGAEYLNRLKEKSLVHQMLEDEQTVTFVMLETLREYALEQLAASGEVSTLQRAHADYYLRLTETAEPNLTGASQVEWFNRLETEHHNVEAALEWLINSGDFEGAGRMAAVLWRVWGAHSRLSAGSQWAEQVLAQADTLTTRVRAKVTHGAGRLQYLQYHLPQAAEYLKTSLGLYEQCGDQSGQAAATLSLGEIEFRQGNFLAAEGYFQSSLALYVALDDQAGFARCLGQLGRLALREGNLPGAESLFQQSLELVRQYGSTESAALVMNDLAEVLRAQGKYPQAAALYRESLALYRQLDFDAGVAVMLHNLGQVARQQGEYDESLRCFQDALGLLQNLEEKQIIVECLAGVGGVFLKLGEAGRAVRFLSAANTLMTASSMGLDFADQTEYEANLDAARRQLDAAAWAAAWAEGQSMRLEQVLADALRGRDVSFAAT